MSVLTFDAILLDDRADDVAVSWRESGEALARRNLRADVSEMARRASAAGCSRGVVIADDSYAFLVGLLGLGAAGATAVILPNTLPGTMSAFAGTFDHVVSAAPGPAGNGIAIPCGAGTPACPVADLAGAGIEFFTSGSTGAPKRIVKTLSHLEREAASLDALWPDLPVDARAVATVPHQHIYGLAFKVVWPLLTGRPFAAVMETYWESLLSALLPGAVVVCSPAHLMRLDGIEPLPSARRPRMVFSAGAPLPRTAAEECRRVLGVLPTEIYGSTETGALATRSQQGEVALWQPLPGVEARRAEDGRLQIRARHVDERSWVSADDRVEFSDRGFTLLGRADRVVKIEGKRVGLPEVEQSLARLPWVTQAAVVALPGERTVLAAVVALSQAGRDKLAELGAFRLGRMLRRELAQGLEPAGLPRRWRFVAALPVGAMGKTATADLAALFDGTGHD